MTEDNLKRGDSDDRQLKTVIEKRNPFVLAPDCISETRKSRSVKNKKSPQSIPKKHTLHIDQAYLFSICFSSFPVNDKIVASVLMVETTADACGLC